MKRLTDGRAQTTMSWHRTEAGAQEYRDRLDEIVRTVTGPTYHVEKGRFIWKVVKRWYLHANGKQILGSSKRA